WCPILPSACEEAAFLRQGAPPVAVYRSEPPYPPEVRIAVRNRTRDLVACQLAALGRAPDAEGTARFVARVGDDGTVPAVIVTDGFDAEHAACLASALRGLKFRVPLRGPARVEGELPQFHRAGVQLDAVDGAEGEEGMGHLRQDLPAWGAPVDACVTAHDVPELGIELRLRFVARPDGTFDEIEVVASSETEAVDRCVIDWLAARRTDSVVEVTTRVAAKITFLVPTELGDPRRVPPVPVPASGPPVIVRTRVVLVSRAAGDGGRDGKLRRATRTAITEAHAALAAYVSRATGGAVALETEVVSVDARLRGLAAVEDEPGATRWTVSLADLPPAVRRAIPPARYDSVFLWFPAPPGAAPPPIGWTPAGATIRGATVSALAAPSTGPLRPNLGTPLFERPLHEWWHQVEGRTDRLLRVGVPWLPSNHVPLTAGARVLDPRGWMDPPSLGVVDWYDEVLATRIPPDFWSDVWTGGVRVDRPEEDLALRGEPIGDGVLGLDGLNDGLVSFGAYADLPYGDPDATDVWFGVELRDPAVVGQVVAHIGSIDLPDAPSFVRSTLEVDTGGGWVPVRADPITVVNVDGVVTRWTFDPVEIVGARIVVTDGALQPVCRELELRAR
ncbi:MAG: hypothetical protein ABMB14_22750, partial [Myxococcota bacterium]